MVYNCLKLSSKYKLDYIEITPDQRKIPLGYDFYFFNYHPNTMAWMDTSRLKNIPGIIITIVLEVLPGDPFVMCPDNHFHSYCVLDPTIKIHNKKVFAFPRPLEVVDSIKPYEKREIPVIGTFGFATKGKGFHHVVEAVNREFNEAVVRINIPYGDFVPESETYAKFLANICRKKAKEGIEVVVTHEYMSKEKLIDWCAQNTLNCFLYDRDIQGLAATTDQAIVSGRPLAVSKNDTFRHILMYLTPYPEITLSEAIEKSIPAVKQMQHDWSREIFAQRFEEMLDILISRHPFKKQQDGDYEIPLAKKGVIEFLQKRYRKYKRFLSIKKLKRMLVKRRRITDEEFI